MICNGSMRCVDLLDIAVNFLLIIKLETKKILLATHSLCYNCALKLAIWKNLDFFATFSINLQMTTLYFVILDVYLTAP